MPLPILGSEGPRGVITLLDDPDPLLTLQVNTWVMTGVFVQDDILAWSITIGATVVASEITMDVDLETTGALLAADIEALMDPDTVAATFDTETLTLTSEALGTLFVQAFSAPAGVPVFPTTANLGAVNSYGNPVLAEKVSRTGRASQQPASGSILQMLPEGEREGVFETFLSYDWMRTADQHSGREATIITNYEGISFIVSAVAETRAVIPHFTALASRVPEGLNG